MTNKIFTDRPVASGEEPLQPPLETVELEDQLVLSIIRVEQQETFRFAAAIGDQVVGVFVDYDELVENLPMLLMLPEKTDDLGVTSL